MTVLLQAGATLIINVESMSTTSDVQINTFQDAFQVDANLKAQILSVNDVTFSNHNFPLASYNTTEDYSLSDGRIRYVYTFNSGTRGTISSSGWDGGSNCNDCIRYDRCQSLQ